MTEPARATRPTALKRAVVVAAAALLVASGALVSAGPPAHADTLNVTNQTALRTALGASSPGLVQLGGSFEVTGVNLTVNGDATLDLNGHVLTTKNIIVSSGVTLTITDDSAVGTGQLKVTTGATEGAGIQTTDATLIVNGGHIQITARGGAGIGGRNSMEEYTKAPAGGTTVINGGNVEVRSGSWHREGAAGIGGGAAALRPGSVTPRLGTGGGDGGYTEINGGTVSVVGNYGAGIGGGAGTAALGWHGYVGGEGGTTVINGGTVYAMGEYGAGIGGGQSGVYAYNISEFGANPGGGGGELIVNGGHVNAVGGGGAGVGGAAGGDLVVLGLNAGSGGAGGTVVVAGGRLTAHGYHGAGIGGADSGEVDGRGGDGGFMTGGDMGSVTVAAGAEVRASRQGAGTRAIGAGVTRVDGSYLGDIGHGYPGNLTVDGTLELPLGQELLVPSEDTPISGNGLITGVDGAGGTIINHGTVTPHVDLDQVDVTVRNFPVTFESNAPGGESSSQVVNVFATSMATGARSVPGALSAGAVLTGWNHSADGTGSAFTADTTLSGPLTVFGQWDTLAYSISSNMPDARVGQPVAFSIGAVGGSPAGDLSEQFTFTADGGEPQITDNAVTFTRPGTWTVTATHDTTGVTVQQQVPVELVLSDPAAITLSLSGADVFVGDTVSATVTGVDAYGNALGEITHLATISSGHATDTVTGAEIEVGERGLRNVSAAVGGAGAQQPLTVWPHAADYTLSATPASPYVGDDVALTVTVDGDEVTGDFTFATAAPGATITGSQAMFERPGTHVITATHAVTGVELDRVLNVSVDRTTPAHIEMHLSDTTIDVGGSIFFDVTGTDRFGNNLGGLNDLATVTSSHPTDIIDPTGSIHFPTASEHTITAVVGQASASVVVTVIPAAVPMPEDVPAPEGEPGSASDSGALPGEGDTSGTVGGQSGLPSTGVENFVRIVGAIAILIIGVGATLIIRRKRDSDDHSDA